MAQDEQRSPAKRASARDRDDDDDEGIDLSQLRDIAGYVLRAPKRQPLRFAIFGVMGLALGITTYRYYPRVYSTEVKILAQRNLVLPALGNPNRSVPREADNPTKNVGDAIMQHDNLVGLIKQVDLLDRWEATRPPILRLKDRFFSSEGSSDTDRLRAIEGVLEKRLTVVNDDTTITISVDWTDPQMAFDIADTVEKNFIDARYDAEVNVINDAISILEQHANEEHSAFDTARTEFENVESKAKAARRGGNPVAGSQTTQRSATLPIVPTTAAFVDPQVLADLEAKRAAIKQIQDPRNARIADLNRQINDALVSLSPAHPTVVALKQRLADAQTVPPELSQLRSEELALIHQVAASPPPPPTPQANGPANTVQLPMPLIQPLRPVDYDEDPAVTVARMKLQTSAQKYAELQSRIDSAKIEGDIAKTAHKYRYSIVHPPEVTLRPRKPNPMVLVLGIVLGVLMLAFGAVVRNERAKGRFLEGWQLRRRLKLPVIGEIEA